MKTLIRAVRARLIDDLRGAARFWSLRLQALGFLLQSLFLGWADLPLQIWSMMPEEVKAFLPQRAVSLLPLAFFGGAMAARLFKQKSK